MSYKGLDYRTLYCKWGLVIWDRGYKAQIIMRSTGLITMVNHVLIIRFIIIKSALPLKRFEFNERTKIGV